MLFKVACMRAYLYVHIIPVEFTWMNGSGHNLCLEWKSSLEFLEQASLCESVLVLIFVPEHYIIFPKNIFEAVQPLA